MVTPAGLVPPSVAPGRLGAASGSRAPVSIRPVVVGVGVVAVAGEVVVAGVVSAGADVVSREGALVVETVAVAVVAAGVIVIDQELSVPVCFFFPSLTVSIQGPP